jgi:ABC-type transport system substrate-binding protein
MDMNVEDGNYQLTPHISGYDNPEYDAIIEKAYKETDKNKRADLLHQAEKLLMTDMPIAPLVQLKNGYISNSDISGIKTNYYGAFMFTKAVLKNRDKYEEPAETKGGAEK